MRAFCLVLCIFLLMLPVQAKHLHKEKEYQKVWCDANKGIIEYKLDDAARVDCLTKKYAVEVDFAPKWSECIGQAVYYAKKTNRKPACLLILESPDDVRFLYRLKYAVNQKKKIKGFGIYTIEPDVLYQ